MNKLIKAGRFSYLLPYIIMPVVVMLAYHEDFQEAFIYSFLLFFGIESPLVILYPVSWIITIVCFIRCFIENKRNADRKAQIINTILILLTILWTIIHVLMIVQFLNNFHF